MADIKSKLALAGALLVVGVGGALMFRHPKPGPEKDGFEPAPLVLEEPGLPPAAETLVPSSPPPKPEPPPAVSHLLGMIEPQDPPPADADRSYPPDSGVAEVSAHHARRIAPAVTHSERIIHELPEPRGESSRRTHIVEEGDTLSALARKYLGAADRYPALYAANRRVLRDPDRLPVGTVLEIPKAAVKKPAAPPSTNQPTTIVAIQPGTWRRSRTSSTAPRSYTVQGDETLADIARQLYGDSSRGQEIYEANRDRLSGPDDLRAGLLLVVP